MTQSSKSNDTKQQEQPLDQDSMASVLGKRARPIESVQGMQLHNVYIASQTNATKIAPPSLLASSAEPISISPTMKMSTQRVRTMSEKMQSAMASWTTPSIFQAFLFQSSTPRSKKEPLCLQVRVMVREKCTRLPVCLVAVWDSSVANVVRRRRTYRTASNTQNTPAPRCSV